MFFQGGRRGDALFQSNRIKQAIQLQMLRRMVGRITRVALERRSDSLEVLSNLELGFLRVLLMRQIVPASEKDSFAKFFLKVTEHIKEKAGSS